MKTAVERDGVGGVVVLDRYRLGHRLGGGGFGVVYAAHDLKLDRAVAVKRIPAADPAIAERARREGIAAARLSHAGIVALHETGADEDAVFLVSELVDGRTLDRRCADGELSDRDVLRIGVTLCDALAHAHKSGVIHRDVKPANVLIPDAFLDEDAGPPAKLTDFGIARLTGDDALTRTGDVVGTLAYMAPEQAEGRGAGPEADLYALGLCLYEALSGVNPVRARGAGATVRRIGLRLPPLGRLRRDLPLELCDAIDATVRPQPGDRGTIRQLKAALKAQLELVGDEPGTIEGSALEPLAPVARRPVRPWRPARRALSAAACALVGAAVLHSGWLAAPATWPTWVGACALAGLVAPRLGPAVVLAGLCIWLAGGAAGSAVVLAAAALPLLAVPWLPGPRFVRRLAAGAAGGWIAVLAVRADEAEGWEAVAGDGWRDVVTRALDGGAGWTLAVGALAGVLAGSLWASRRA